MNEIGVYSHKTEPSRILAVAGSIDSRTGTTLKYLNATEKRAMQTTRPLRRDFRNCAAS